jgi:hypothetical protein
VAAEESVNVFLRMEATGGQEADGREALLITTQCGQSFDQDKSAKQSTKLSNQEINTGRLFYNNNDESLLALLLCHLHTLKTAR